MSKAPENKFIVFVLLLAVVSFLQVTWRSAFGWAPEFLMAFLVAAAFHLGLLEFSIISAAGFLLFGWAPSPQPDMIVFFAIPFAAYFCKAALPWRSGFNNFVMTVAAVCVFYALTNIAAVAADPLFFAAMVLVTAGFGAALLQSLGYFYRTS